MFERAGLRSRAVSDMRLCEGEPERLVFLWDCLYGEKWMLGRGSLHVFTMVHGAHQPSSTSICKPSYRTWPGGPRLGQVVPPDQGVRVWIFVLCRIPLSPWIKISASLSLFIASLKLPLVACPTSRLFLLSKEKKDPKRQREGIKKRVSATMQAPVKLSRSVKQNQKPSKPLLYHSFVSLSLVCIFVLCQPPFFFSLFFFTVVMLWMNMGSCSWKLLIFSLLFG